MGIKKKNRKKIVTTQYGYGSFIPSNNPNKEEKTNSHEEKSVNK